MIDIVLKARLSPVARRQRGMLLAGQLTGCWLAALAAGLVLTWALRQVGVGSVLLLPGVGAAGLLAACVAVARHRRQGPDWRAVALAVERRHPELEGRLLTAVEWPLAPQSEPGYLERRLLDEVLDHSYRYDWARAVPGLRRALLQGANLLALGLLLVTFHHLQPAARRPAPGGILARSGIDVTPGDTSLERGSSLVVMARFSGGVPAAAELVLGQPDGQSRRLPLVRSLSDPMFGGTVPDVTADFSYRVEFSGRKTRDFAVRVFECPRLEKADAETVYPAYTGIPAKRVEDTRRVTAVEGTRLTYTLQLNKPVASAQLVPRDKDRAPIRFQVESNRAMALLAGHVLETSQSYRLVLADREGRTNKVPDLFVFSVLTNRLPEFKVARPRGDIRPSALEEVSFEGTVRDDFGLQAYGLGYARPGHEPQSIELGRAAPGGQSRSFRHVLRLEDLDVREDDLVSWYVWADDLGPDGQVRRTTGDLYFAEVRPFEEVFREGQGTENSSDAQSEQSGEQSDREGNPSEKLAELEKQIIGATWKLQRQKGISGAPPSLPGVRSAPGQGRRAGGGPGWVHALPWVAEGLSWAMGQAQRDAPARRGATSAGRAAEPAASAGAPPGGEAGYRRDASVVHDSQGEALEQAKAALERQQDPRTAALWRNAIAEMEKALARLEEAGTAPARLAEALAAEQAAYQALLALREREFSVNRARSNSRGQRNNSGRQQQMQRQLDQLELRQSENRYETGTQAQAPQTPERREQLQALNRLQELARRQQDVNERLRELQSALQEARSEQEREEARRRLQRLQEEERRVLADVDELRQRLERPENQATMDSQRQQLEQARQDVQRAAEAAAQGAASQALASGTRAQRQMQEMRDELRRRSSGQFGEDLRQMRADARELTRQQQELERLLDAQGRNAPKSLSDTNRPGELMDRLAQQKVRLTNLVERATEVSRQTENSEPLVSQELYNSVRQFAQDDLGAVNEFQERLLDRGMLTRGLAQRLRATAEQDGAKALELTAEMLRQGWLPQAGEAEQRARAGIDAFRGGIERAAEKILGDDTDALRQAQRQLEDLAAALRREGGAPRDGATNQVAPNPAARQATAGGTAAAPQAQAEDRSAQSPEPSTAEASREGQAGERAAQAGQPGQRGQPGEPANRQAPGQEQARNRGGGPGQGEASRADRAAPNEAPDRAGDRTARVSQNRPDGPGGRGGRLEETLNQLAEGGGDSRAGGPITGPEFGPWSDRLREVEEMVELPYLRQPLAVARERARQMRLDFRRDLRKPDWAVVQLQVLRPLVEVRDAIAEELARRGSTEKLVPIDRDPVPSRYSELVRRYYEDLGREK